ncbi:hypothetical protein [Engelhardtia mirabilis]|uniref:hypothetical protein n=1 Tax=Engelhardtia mirabilis TaxID=2528011 RepID=UPI0011A5AE2B
MRDARARLSKQVTPSNYVALAQECAMAGDLREARRVATEGLGQFPTHGELRRIAERIDKQDRESRLGELRSELVEGPRDAVFRELVDLLLESGDVSRAEQTATDWCAKLDGPEARLAVARARVERFIADRGRDVGQLAFEALDQFDELRGSDKRSWRLRLQITTAIGAWREARRAAARLLELEPGSPALEARFRTLDTLCADAPDVNQALREVEKTGRLVDDPTHEQESERDGLAHDVRPVLRELTRDQEIRAALYLRGSTALVQGPKGATAERTARQVREVVQSGRTVARRLGLGRITDLRLEGDFGTLSAACSEADSAAMWSSGKLTTSQERALVDLVGWRPTVDGVER